MRKVGSSSLPTPTSTAMNETRIHKIESVVLRRRADIIVVLEDIHDPHNAAAILRTCDGLGIQNVYFVFEKEKRYNPKRVGKASSSSANKWLDFKIFDSAESCIKDLKNKGYTVVVTALNERAEALDTARFPERKIALYVGNEHAGVSDTAINLADRVVMIPMKGFVQSFNVSVATAVFLWDLVSKRPEEPLGADESTLLISSFLKR